MRETPENTVVISKNLDIWRTKLEKYGPHVRVLYLEGGDPGQKNINFYTTDIVVICINPKLLKDPILKPIKKHQWYRLVMDHEDKDAVDFIKQLNVSKKWAIRNSDMLAADGYSLPFKAAGLTYFIPKIKNLYHFGSKVVKTLGVELTSKEKDIYMLAEVRAKDKLSDFKLRNKKLEALGESDKSNKDIFQDLEASIIRLREMLSNIALAVKKGDIEGNPDLMKTLNDVGAKDICSICGCELKSSTILCVTVCNHVFCCHCLEDYLLKLDNKMCPLCRRALQQEGTVFTSPLNCAATKADILLNRLKIKSLVISKYDNLLGWLQNFLQEKGFRVERIDGKTQAAEQILEIANMVQTSTDEDKMLLLANYEAISGEMDISSIHQVFFMEAVKENEENSVMNHITGSKGQRNGTFQGAYRLVVENAVERKIVGLKGKVEDGFKEFNRKEINEILT